MSRAPSNFRQQDVARAIKAAKGAGLNLVRVEVDPKTAKIVMVVKGEDEMEQAIENWDDAPMPALGKRRRK